MKRFIVYMHIFPNNKKYIGITCKSPNGRWEGGTGYSKLNQSVMYNAIQKYGWENVKHEILFTDLSFDEAKQKEIELIKKYNTYFHAKNSQGYNMTKGGEGTLGHKCSIETKQKMSQKRIGKYKGDNCYKSKAVICDNIRYESITEFCGKFNLGRQMVEKWFNHKSAMPLYWINKGLRLENDTNTYIPQKKPYNYQIEYDGEIFNSQAQFAKFIGISPPLLCKIIKKNKIPKEWLEKGFRKINTLT